ncbi:MAG: DUF4159 domain-containing protein [bacterium]
MRLHRRQFLATAALGALAAPRAFAMGADAEVGIGLLQHGVGFDARPGAVEQLMWEVSKRTSIDVRERPRLLTADDPDLFRFPLLVWIGTAEAPPLDAESIRRLRRYLRAGGMLYIDDASPGDAFDATIRTEIARLWPDQPLLPLDADHTLYRSFFLLDRPEGRVRRRLDLEGVTFDDRALIVYGRNDLFGAFGRDPLGGWVLPVVPDGNRQREMAFRLGINLVMYATCLNYKRDQVHTTAILRRRRWRVSQ